MGAPWMNRQTGKHAETRTQRGGLINMREGESYLESENEDEEQADSLNNQAWQFYSVGRSQKRIKYSLFSHEIAALRSQ